MMEPLVFLEDAQTFSPINGATILLGDYSRQYNLAKLFAMMTPEQLSLAEVEVADSAVSAANEGLE